MAIEIANQYKSCNVEKTSGLKGLLFGEESTSSSISLSKEMDKMFPFLSCSTPSLDIAEGSCFAGSSKNSNSAKKFCVSAVVLKIKFICPVRTYRKIKCA